MIMALLCRRAADRNAPKLDIRFLQSKSRQINDWPVYGL